MIAKTCDLWLEKCDFRCILTTGEVAPDGEAIMDTPTASQATKRYAGLPVDFGHLLQARGNHVHLLRPGLLSFPIRQTTRHRITLEMIVRSARELSEHVGEAKTLLPQPGCGPGELQWSAVSDALSFLPDNIIVVTAKTAAS